MSIFAQICNIGQMTTKEIGETVRLRREGLRLRQEDLAEMSGVAIRTIHLVESGEGNPSLETLKKLGDVLGMELSLQVKKLSDGKGSGI